MNNSTQTKNKGITLIALVITIVVLLILAGVGINVFFGSGLTDQAKKSRFTYTIRALEEMATLHENEKYFDENLKREDVIPNKGKLTQEEKDTITKNVPTLAESVYLATGETIYDRNIYWLDKDKTVSETPETEYLIDMDTLQVYQYNGTYFFKKMWHTLDVGVDDKGNSGEETIPDGYMKIHLYYPEGSIDRKWRIGRPGESRTDDELMWQDYTGDAILVRIDDIKNIWIKYNLKGVEVVEAPKGQLAVDITATPRTPNQSKVTVSVYYDKDSTNQKIKVGNGGWRLYTGPFEITENCTIQAMAEKLVNVTDSNGSVIGTTKIKGKDSLTVTNIGKAEKDETLSSPKIIEVEKISTEKARARIDYPTDVTDIKKVYKINNGIEQEYTGEIAIEEWGTELKAYYYKNEKRSPEVNKTFNDPTKLEVSILVQPNPTMDETIKTATVEIEYSEEAESKTYKIDDGQEQKYTGPFTVTQDCTVTAYARKTGTKEGKATETIKFKKQTQATEKEKISAPKFSAQNSSDYTKATITIKYDAKAISKQYSVNGGELSNYEEPIQVVDGDVIYAINTDEKGNSADATYTVTIKKPMIKAPTFTQVDNSDKTKTTITINYDITKAIIKQYSINDGELKNYEGPIEAVDGDIIYALNTDTFNQTADATYNVKIGSKDTQEPDNPENPDKPDTPDKPEKEELQAPIISANYSADKQKATISIKYDKNAITKQYKIDDGTLENYSSSFDVTKNGTVIYAVNTDSNGNSKSATYTVKGLVKKLDVTISTNPTTSNANEVTVTIDYDTNATSKTYTINGGTSQNYTGPFKVTTNCTIVAEAKAKEAYGKDTKQITNLTQGLAAPVIKETKTTEAAGEIANITITYDTKSISNTYTINNGKSPKYAGSFQIRENDTVITAYSVDSSGNTAVSQYVVKDLVRYLLIEKEKYYWITLPYPEQAINKEYKYKADGVWKEYKEDGFILVKSEYEEELIQGGKPVKLEVETGRYVDFDGHWYILDTDPKKLQEDIYMRWDNSEESTIPKVSLQIIAMPEPPEKTDSVDVFIVYPPTATAKQYKINNGEYKNYTGQLSIKQNNTTITAKTQYSDGSWSEEVSYTITNIDENVAPEGIIDITAVPTEWTTGDVTVTIKYNPNSDVLKKKYKVGKGSWQYTEDNTVTLTISQNNTTIYAALENNAGESSDAETYNVGNIDKYDPVVTATTPTSMVIEDEYDVTIKLTDGDSGINLSKCRWTFDQTSTQIGTNESDYQNEFTSETETVKLTATVTGNWYLHILATDNIGHTVETVKGPIVANPPWITDSKLTSNDRLTSESKTVIAQDKKGNQIVIPGGFKIAADSGTTVQQGVVIEDKDGNQFVWVPVSNINADGSNLIILDDGSKVEITLGRYKFDSQWNSTTKVREGTGKATLVQKGSEYAETTISKVANGNVDTKYRIDNCYYELSDYRVSNEASGQTAKYATNTTAKNLQAFIEKTRDNKGYYIARYEASYGSGYNKSASSMKDQLQNAKPLSKPSTAITSSGMSYTTGYLWKVITQPNAALVSKNMYVDNSYVESDLANSYAWDTAIVYIQKMGYTDYANASCDTTENKTIMNTGSTGDEKCKIFDMAGNAPEWTTEYSSYVSTYASPCTYRGGYYYNSKYCTCVRFKGAPTYSSMTFSFRTIFYVK